MRNLGIPSNIKRRRSLWFNWIINLRKTNIGSSELQQTNKLIIQYYMY